MKNNNLNFIVCIIVMLILFISYYCALEKNNDIYQIRTEYIIDTVYIEKDTVYCFVNTNNEEIDWNKFIQAVIHVESKGNKNAVGNNNDVGVLQIRQTIVDDCNRIVGYDKYSMNDRTDSLKSVEMFNVIQNYYNPKKDPHYALKIWNPRSSFNYHFKIAKHYDKLVG